MGDRPPHAMRRRFPIRVCAICSTRVRFVVFRPCEIWSSAEVNKTLRTKIEARLSCLNERAPAKLSPPIDRSIDRTLGPTCMLNKLMQFRQQAKELRCAHEKLLPPRLFNSIVFSFSMPVPEKQKNWTKLLKAESTCFKECWKLDQTPH